MPRLRTWFHAVFQAAKRLNHCLSALVLSVNGGDLRALDDKELCRIEMMRLARRSLLWIVIGVPIGLAVVAAVTVTLKLLLA